jgi:hypothetical protein
MLEDQIGKREDWKMMPKEELRLMKEEKISNLKEMLMKRKDKSVMRK